MTDQTHLQHAPTPARLTCQQVADLLVDYVTEEMAPAIHAALEAHLHGCTDCIAFLNTYKETMRASRTVRAEDIPVEMLNRVQQFLHTKMQDPRPE
jgi:hypothetical protein